MDVQTRDYKTVRILFHILTAATLAVLSSSMLISCASLKSHLSLAHRAADLPIDAFGLVVVNTKMLPGQCVKNEKFEICKEVIKELPVVQQNSTGSGLLVWANQRPVFLTAAHVCGTQSPEKAFYEKEGVEFDVTIEVDIHIRGNTQKMHPATIIKLDQQNDLCALSVPTFKAPPVKFSRSAPKMGDEVMALSAPFGINSPTMTLVFKGRYSGTSGPWHYYTIPTRPGSSGSVVLNKNYRGVGMLNAAFVHIESLGMGAGHKDTLEFLKSID